MLMRLSTKYRGMKVSKAVAVALVSLGAVGLPSAAAHGDAAAGAAAGEETALVTPSYDWRDGLVMTLIKRRGLGCGVVGGVAGGIAAAPVNSSSGQWAAGVLTSAGVA